MTCLLYRPFCIKALRPLLVQTRTLTFLTHKQTSTTTIMQRKEDDLKSLAQPQNDGTTHATVHATVQVPPKDEVQYITKGIFTIAYDKVNYFSSSSFSPTSLISDFGRLKTASDPVFRYLGDLRRLSQWHALELYLWMVGKIITPSFSLYFGSLVILNVYHPSFLRCSSMSDSSSLQVDALWRDENTRDEIFKDIQFEIMAWMLCGIMSYQLDVAMCVFFWLPFRLWRSLLTSSRIRLRGELGGRVRYEFIPKLVEGLCPRIQFLISQLRFEFLILFTLFYSGFSMGH